MSCWYCDLVVSLLAESTLCLFVRQNFTYENSYQLCHFQWENEAKRSSYNYDYSSQKLSLVFVCNCSAWCSLNITLQSVFLWLLKFLHKFFPVTRCINISAIATTVPSSVYKIFVVLPVFACRIGNWIAYIVWTFESKRAASLDKDARSCSKEFC